MPQNENQTLAINCLFGQCASSLRAHPENGSLVVFAMLEIWCAKSVSDNSGCVKPCLLHLFLFTQNKKAHIRDVYCAENKTKFQFYKVYSSASGNSGSHVTHPSTQTYDRMNGRCLFFTLQVSRKDSVAQEGAVMSIQWQMVHTKPERTVRQKYNSHHLSAFAHFGPSQKQDTVWLVAWIKVIFFGEALCPINSGSYCRLNVFLKLFKQRTHNACLYTVYHRRVCRS